MLSFTPILGLADTTRPYLLMLFVVALFGVAGLAVFVGQRKVQRAQAAALSEDIGIAKGASAGADTTHSADWLSAAREEADDTPKHSWQEAILGPGSVHLDHDEEDADAGPVLVTDEQHAPELAPAMPVPADPSPVMVAAPMVAETPPVTFVDDVAPAPVPSPEVEESSADLVPAAHYAGVSIPPVPPIDAGVAPSGSGGKRRADVPVDAPSSSFLVYGYLDED